MKSLYRYRAVSDLSIYGIENNEFYFASPADFNDPFDCKNLFTFHGASDADWRIFLKNLLIYKQPHLTELQQKEAVEKVIMSGEHRSREKLTEQGDLWGSILENESNKLGIVCLSEKPDDILMWSHYGCNHKGFSLQFDGEILANSFYCCRVRYRKEYPTFHEFVRSNLDEIARTFLFTKSNHWKYEKEVRLMVNAETPDGKALSRIIKYPSHSLTGIIFGCQTSDPDKQRIIDALCKNGTNVPTYQCEKSRSSYSVKIVAS